MRPPSSEWIRLGGLLLVALGTRLAAAGWWQARLDPNASFAFPDSQTYWILGQALANGEPFQYGSPDASIFRMPGYPWLLSLLFRLLGTDASVMWARGLGAVLGTLAVAALYALARQMFDRSSALIAAAMGAVYPGAVGMSVFVLSEALFCPLMLAQLALWAASWQSASRRGSIWLAAASGLVAGLATLTRPSWLAFVPFAILAGLVGGQRRRHLVLGAVAVAGLALAMLPWWVRNARLVGHFVPTTLQVGASLYDGLNPRADGGSDMSFVPRFEALERANAAAGEPFEYRLDRRMRNEAIEYARNNPGRALALAAIKAARMWNVWPNEPISGGWLVGLVMLLTYVPALGLALAGAWKYRRLGWPYALCWLPAGYLTLLHMIFVSSIRYREPAMLALLVLSAATVRGVLASRGE
ncbi:MAG: glycosyltransferase family 39 protein [Pirellulales bacterium]